MGNHYHVLIETPRANLGRVMRHINGVYTQRYNRLKKRFCYSSRYIHRKKYYGVSGLIFYTLSGERESEIRTEN